MSAKKIKTNEKPCNSACCEKNRKKTVETNPRQISFVGFFFFAWIIALIVDDIIATDLTVMVLLFGWIWLGTILLVIALFIIPLMLIIILG